MSSSISKSSKANIILSGLYNNETLLKFLYNTQDELISNKNITEEKLRLSSHILRPIDYNYIKEERNLSTLCAYPACKHKNKINNNKSNFKIDMKNKKIIELEDNVNNGIFCNNECKELSNKYESNLEEEPMFLRKWATEYE